MASLSGDDVDLLDADPIEDELHALKLEGLSSQIGWSTGAWHSSSDSEEGVRKARTYSMALGIVGKTGTFHLSGNRPYARTPVKPDPGEARELGVITMDSEPTGADAGMWPKWDFEIAVQDGAREGDKIIVAGCSRQPIGSRRACASTGAGSWRASPAPRAPRLRCEPDSGRAEPTSGAR
jgi:hypothetical protein